MGLQPITEQFFRSSPAYEQGVKQIDRDAGIIRGVRIVRMGEAKSHGVHLDGEFISEVVRLGNAAGQVKSRFGHPNMSSSAIGTYLGTFKNFSEKDGAAFADLHLDEVAKKAPQGDLHEYVLAMAESASKHFGNSIAFSHDGEQYVKDKEGNKRRIVYERTGIFDFKVMVEQEDGTLEDYDTEKYSEEVFIKIVHLHASDLVDDPAATESLFSTTAFDSDLLAAQVSNFLDQHPEVWQFVDKHPEKVAPFLRKYHAYQQRQSGGETQTSNTTMENFTNINTALETELNTDSDGGIYLNAEQAAALDAHLSTSSQNSDELTARVEELTTTSEQQATELEAANTTIAERDETIAQQETELAELRQGPATDHSEGGADKDFQKGKKAPEKPWEAAGRKMYNLGKKRASANADA